MIQIKLHFSPIFAAKAAIVICPVWNENLCYPIGGNFTHNPKYNLYMGVPQGEYNKYDHYQPMKRGLTEFLLNNPQYKLYWGLC